MGHIDAHEENAIQIQEGPETNQKILLMVPSKWSL